MDRFSELRSQHSAAMRAGRPGALELLLPCGRRSRGKPSLDAFAGRAVHAYAVLRDPADDGMATSQRARGQSQACGAPATAHGLGGHLSEAAPEPGRAGAQDLSVPAPRAGDPPAEPGVEHGHHVHSSPARVCVSGGHHGLLQPLRFGLGSIGDHGHVVLPIGARVGAATGEAGDFQQRPGLTVYERGFYKQAQKRRNSDQHGRSRARLRQHLRRTAVAYGQVRGGLPQGLRERRIWSCESGRVFRLLQPRTAPSGSGVSNACFNLQRSPIGPENGDVQIWAEARSFVYGQINAIFLAFSAASYAGGAEIEKMNSRILKAKSYGLWKMPSLWKSAKSADSHRDLGKSRKKQRDFPTFPTGPTGLSFPDVKTKTRGSESTLRKSLFCLDNGVHLTALGISISGLRTT
jgi:hypothetical protein